MTQSTTPDGYGCTDLGAFVHYCKQPKHPFFWAKETPAWGGYETGSGYFYVGGFDLPRKKPGNQDAYIVYPIGIRDKFPLVAFAPGCCKMGPNNTGWDYDAVFRQLASNGIAVVSSNACQWSCDWKMLSDNQLHLVKSLETNMHLHSVLPQIDFSRVGLMGHSAGGIASIRAASFGIPGIRAVVSIHGQAGRKNVDDLVAKGTVPIFFTCGQLDPNHRCHCKYNKQLYGFTPPALQGKNVYAELRHCGHLEIQKRMPGGRWNFYIVQYLMCHLSQNQTACGYMYGTGPYAICNREFMLDCNNSFAPAAKEMKFVQAGHVSAAFNSVTGCLTLFMFILLAVASTTLARHTRRWLGLRAPRISSIEEPLCDECCETPSSCRTRGSD